MANESFAYSETGPLFKNLERLSQRSGVSRGQAFEDWLTAVVCALAAETMEEKYLAMVERHKAGKPGQRGVDLMAEMLAQLVDTMSATDRDILGDLFQSSISYGEAGQYLSPEPLAKLMAELTAADNESSPDSKPPIISDPCCGTGRMLLEASQMNPHAECFGQDIDARCAKISAINLGIRGRYGWIVCGNTLSGETQFAYRIASFFHESPNGRRRGVIREVPPELTPALLAPESTTREKAQDLFNEVQDAPRSPSDQPEIVVPKIMEIPRWLSRLEMGLASQQQRDIDAPASPKSENQSPAIEPSGQSGRLRQQDLF